MNPRRIGFATLAFACLAVAASAAAQEDVTVRAKEHFERGVTAYEVSDYKGALTEFQEAFRLKPHPNVRVNMANCYDKLDQPLRAIFHFEKFMAEADASADQRKEVKSALRRLKQQVGELTLQIAPDGARVQIDDGDQRKAPILEPVRLKAGRHTIKVELDEYKEQSREVDVKGGENQEVSITLERMSAAPDPILAGLVDEQPAAEEAAPAAVDVADVAPMDEGQEATEAVLDEEMIVDEEEPSSGGLLTTPVLIMGSVTLGLLVGTVVSGIVALSAQNNFDTQVGDRGREELTTRQRQQAWDEGMDAADRAETSAAVSDILLGGTIVGAALTTVLMFTSSGSDSGEHALRVTPALGLQRGSVEVSGQF